VGFFKKMFKPSKIQVGLGIIASIVAIIGAIINIFPGKSIQEPPVIHVYPPSPSPPVSPKNLTIKVIDNETSLAINGVKIELYQDGNSPIKRETGNDGLATLPLKNADSSFKITISKIGYEPIDESINYFQETRNFSLKKTSWKPPKKEEGADNQGRTAKFEFYSLINDYGWKIGSTDTVENLTNPQVVKAQEFLDRKLSEQGIRTRIQKSSDVIAVGVASCEGSVSLERERADKRGKVIRQALEPIFTSTEGKLHVLLLGKYNDTNCHNQSRNDTAKQRSLLIIGVTDKMPDVNLQEASEKAIKKYELKGYLRGDDSNNKSPVKPLGIDNYPLFELS
jgi:hypothetical protein